MHLLLAKLWRVFNLPKGLQLFIMRIFNDEFLVGVTGVIVNDKNEVLLVKHTYRQTAWSLPGGYLKGGEHPIEGVQREILEETGLTVKIEKIIKTGHDSNSARLDISCFGKYISGTFTPSAEVSVHGFFAFTDLPEIGEKQKKLIKDILSKEKLFAPSFFHRFFQKIKLASQNS
jgi:8-oxo-dGTP diphosphatase